MALVIKNWLANAGDTRDVGWIPGSGRFPGEGNGNPLQYSCLEIPWTEEPGGLQSTGSQELDTTKGLSTHSDHNRFYNHDTIWMMCCALGRWAQANQQTLQWCKRTPSRFWPGPTLQALLALQAVTIPFQTSAHLKHRSKTPLDPGHWGWKLERGWKDQRQQW